MCDFSMVLGALSAGLGAMGQMQEANARAQAANYQAAVQENNAQLAEFKARDAIIRGNEEQKKQMAYTAEVAGRQRAAMAANNIDVGYGSALDAAVDTAMLGDLDALTIKSNSYREAYDHKIAATNERAGAGLSRLEAKNARAGGMLKAVGTLVGGFGNSYASYKRNTAFV
jgi:hypothetical protein